MPPAAGGAQPRTPDLENNDACWRAKPRANRRRVFPQARFQRGSAPLAARHSSSLLLNVYATVACRRRLQKAPRRIHERLPRTHSRPAQGLGQRPQARLGHARSRQRQSPRPGLAESGCAQEKAELYLLEGRKMPPAAGGLSPRTPDLENNDACWRAKPRANRRHCFPKVFKGAQPLWPPEAFFLFAS